MSQVGMSEKNKKYYKSLDELNDSSEYRKLSKEAPGSAKEYFSKELSRRQVLKISGVAIALAGLSGCSLPVKKIVPFGARPMGFVPGKTKKYSTTMDLNGVGRGIIATNYDGRPIKVDGNPNHPDSLGASDAIAQASVLEMYDPDRSRTVVQNIDGNRKESNWSEFKDSIWGEFHEFSHRHFNRQGNGLYILTEANSSLCFEDMRLRFNERFPDAKWFEYESLSMDNEREGMKLAFGKPYRVHYDMENADVILCLDSDLFGTHPCSLKYAREFSAGRTAENGKMKRMYCVESNLSITGAMADHRLAVNSGSIGTFLLSLLGEILKHPQFEHWGGSIEQYLKEKSYGRSEFSGEFLSKLANDLALTDGPVFISVGSNQPPEVHATVALMNRLVFRAKGRTVKYTEVSYSDRKSHVESIAELAADMNSGDVDTLLILGGNPVYDAPSDLGFEKALSKVNTSVHLSLYEDETSVKCNWHLPKAHWLESWGLTEAWDGTMSIQQPLISPLYNGKTSIEILAMLTNDEIDKGYDLLRRTLIEQYQGSSFEKDWRKSLHDGVIKSTRRLTFNPRLDYGNIENIIQKLLDSETRNANEGYELVFKQDYCIHDGRFANNGWLMELPDPMTKATWDNAAVMGPETAKKLNVARGGIIKIINATDSIEIPVYVQPGIADGSIIVNPGYGRKNAGRVGNDTGVDVNSLRKSDGMYFADGMKVEKTGHKNYELATTQDHHTIKSIGIKETSKRAPVLIRAATLEEYKEHPEFVKHSGHHPPLKSLFNKVEYPDHKWGMAIDLSKCNGCSACVVACQAENNIPVVGKEAVIRQREMQWLRIDRYFSGDPNNPDVSFLPMPCQQCENAPCEQVCPVGATMHNDEGLNDMIYNRCVGVRYCLNNCPYKVRRFNFFGRHNDITEIEKMAFNPNVTVRMRGVMEKCTYCIQRIQEAKIISKNENRDITDGEIVPACAQTCPTNAIVFGDLNDETSEVRKLHDHNRSYGILEEYNIKPRTKYLAKLSNPKNDDD